MTRLKEYAKTRRIVIRLDRTGQAIAQHCARARSNFNWPCDNLQITMLAGSSSHEFHGPFDLT
jgi:hypothetical protein